jgi:hypothetical protein
METFVPSGWFSPSLFVLSKLQSHTNKFPQLWHLKWSIASGYAGNRSGVVGVSVIRRKSSSRQTRNHNKVFRCSPYYTVLFCFQISLSKTNPRTLESESVSMGLLEELSGYRHPSLQHKMEQLDTIKINDSALRPELHSSSDLWR